MMNRGMLGIILGILVSGCASAAGPRHVGILFIGREQMHGGVSVEAGRQADEVVRRYHEHLKKMEYEQAYGMLSLRLQKAVILEEFITDQKKIDAEYGKERVFEIISYPLKGQLSALDKDIFEDEFAHYNMITAVYKSVRQKNLVFEFGVGRENGELKIVSMDYGPYRNPKP